MSTKKTEATFATAGAVPPGTVMHLTGAQADARRHALRPVKDWHKSPSDDKRLPFRADTSVSFKAGEVIGLEGEIDRGLAKALDLAGDEEAEAPKAPKAKAAPKPDDAALAAARAEGIKAGRAEMLAEVNARNALFEQLDAAEDAFAAAEGEADTAKAQAQLDAARAAVDDLAPLEA